MTEVPKVPDDVAFFVLEKKKKKQVYLQPTLAAIDFGFPGLCIKQQHFAGIRYVKHSAPSSPYHVWELLWKDEAENERGRSRSKSRDVVHSLQVETTNEGYHQILDRVDLWSVKSSEKERANKSREPSPSPRSPLHPSATTPPEVLTPTEEKKPSAISSLFHAITSRSKSPISRKAGSPVGSPLREFDSQSAIESLPVRSQSDLSGRRTIDAITRALSNPNLEDLDRVDEADEDEEKGEVVSWLERNIGGPSVLSVIRSRSPSPLPPKDREAANPASILGLATSAADLRVRSRSDLTGVRGKAAVARALADADVLRDHWEEGAKISRDNSSGNTSRRRRQAPVMEQDPPFPPKSLSSKKSVSGDSMTGASGEDSGADYYRRKQGGGSNKGLSYEEAAAAAGMLPPQMGSRTLRRDQPPISRSGSSGAEFDGAFRGSPLHYASKGGGSSRGSLEEYPRRRSQRSPRDEDWSDEFEKPPCHLRRPSGEHIERQDSRGRRADKPSPEVAQLLVEFAREREEWKATVSGALDELRELKMKDQMRGRDGPDYAPRSSRRDRDVQDTSEVPDWIWQVLAAGGPQMAGMAAQQAGIRLPEGWANERRYREQRYDRPRY